MEAAVYQYHQTTSNREWSAALFVHARCVCVPEQCMCESMPPYMCVPAVYEHTCHVCVYLPCLCTCPVRVYLPNDVCICPLMCLFASVCMQVLCMCVGTCPSIGVSKVHVCTLGPQLHDHSIMAQGSGMMQRRAAGVVQSINLHSGHPTQLTDNACMPLVSCHVQRCQSLHQQAVVGVCQSLRQTCYLQCVHRGTWGGRGMGAKGSVRLKHALPASLPEQLCALLLC